MLKTNYHTHSLYCDGQGSPEDYAREAARRGLRALGFSSHAAVAASIEYDTSWTMNPEDLPVYLADIDTLKQHPPGDLQIFSGLEVDYIHDGTGPDAYMNENLDFIIGSVHMIRDIDSGRYLSVDGPDEEFEALLRGTFRGDIKAYVRGYYILLEELMERHSFSFLGHFDLIKKKNRGNKYFDESQQWYRSLALEALDLAKEREIPLEVNSGGMSRGAIDTVYPSPWLIEEACRRSIPVVISADAHKPEHVDFHFDESCEICRRAGYRHVRILLDGRWREQSL